MSRFMDPFYACSVVDIGVTCKPNAAFFRYNERAEQTPGSVVQTPCSVRYFKEERRTSVFARGATPFCAMNLSTEKEISFNDGQIVWNYVFLTLLCLVDIFNNGLILTAVLTQRRLQSQINIVVLGSLSIVQLVGGVLSVPINMALVQDYQHGAALKFAVVVTTFCGISSELHLTVLCVDRCFALLDTIRYGNLKKGTVLIAVLVTWSFSLLGSTLSILDFKNYSVFVVTMFFVIPLLIDIFGYGLVYHSVKGDNQTTLLRKELRLAKAFVVMTLVFTLLWLPYMITVILHDHCGSCEIPSSSLFLLVLYCQMLSLCLSALVYYKASLDFRLAFKSIGKELHRFLCKGNDHGEDVSPRSSTTYHGRTSNSSKLGGNTSHTNLGLFADGDEGEHARKKGTSVHESPSAHGNLNDSQLPLARKEEVHIVPFDQARFFGQTDKQEEFLSEDGGDSKSLEEYPEGEINSSVVFDEIDIVPYDQSC